MRNCRHGGKFGFRALAGVAGIALGLLAGMALGAGLTLLGSATFHFFNLPLSYGDRYRIAPIRYEITMALSLALGGSLLIRKGALARMNAFSRGFTVAAFLAVCTGMFLGSAFSVVFTAAPSA